MENCRTCKFWTGNRKRPQVGQCRRFPPQPAGVVPVQSLLAHKPQPGVIYGIPDVNADFWCGEHQVQVELND